MKDHNKLYKWLIVTFIILYAGTAFVSFYHSIMFFSIANAVWLAIILSLIAEIGQASVLFSLLLTKNKHSTLAWSIMFLLTALQVIGNVVSSYDWITKHDGAVESFKQAILFSMNIANPEMFKVIIAWITGGILPIIALSMTALVADNMKLKEEEADSKKEETQEYGKDELPPDGDVGVTNVVEEPVQPVEAVQKIPKSRTPRQKKTKGVVKGKNIKLKPVKDLDSIKKISKGTELIQNIQSEAIKNNNGTNKPQEKNDQTTSEQYSGRNPISTVYDKNGNIIDQNY